MDQAGLSDLEIISQPVEDEDQCLARPVQLVSFGYRDLPLAALDLSLAGSQLLSNTDEDENRDGWVKLVVCCAACLCRCHRLVFYCLILCALMASVSDRQGLWFQTANNLLSCEERGLSDTLLVFLCTVGDFSEIIWKWHKHTRPRWANRSNEHWLVWGPQKQLNITLFWWAPLNIDSLAVCQWVFVALTLWLHHVFVSVRKWCLVTGQIFPCPALLFSLLLWWQLQSHFACLFIKYQLIWVESSLLLTTWFQCRCVFSLVLDQYTSVSYFLC